jgi:GNAT superfamily N-acetyltransferase
MSRFTIEDAVIGDIPDIIVLAEKVWWLTYEPIVGKEQCDYMFAQIYSPEALNNQMSVENHCFLLLKEAGSLVGFASFSCIGEDTYKLHKLYVDGQNRGKGAGRFLITAVEERVCESDGAALQLNVNRYNKARLFYEAMGYREIRQEDISIGPYWMNDFVMSKALVG